MSTDPKRLGTDFAPAERASAETLRKQVISVEKHQEIHDLFDTIPNITMVLNQERQIVYSNQCLLDFLCLDRDAVSGRRPGEAIQCIHARETPGGCGTSEHCSTCGAVLSILSSQETGDRVVNECQILREAGDYQEALDFRVWSDQVEIEGCQYTILSILDISDEKRRRVLERIFFHDIRNTVGALINCSELMKCRIKAEDNQHFIDIACALSGQLLSEIQGQEQLLAAEHNELEVRPASVQTISLLKSQIAKYDEHPINHGRTIRLDPEAENLLVETDPVLLERVITNMLKNAIEATADSGTVSLGCTSTDRGFQIWVHNPGEMPREVQLQVFHRSFSTKGDNRGIGTYSMKLLTERYLRGKVCFTTDPSGTVFRVELPLSL